MGYNTAMEKELNFIINRLKKTDQTISFAESCTGGRIAAAFTAVPGISKIFHGACITYANHIKSEWLGVTAETLEKDGAVSQKCVEEMLRGIQRQAVSDYAMAVSGIAGPDGGSVEKPVGTVYIGILSPSETLVKRYHFEGNRESIQYAATKAAIKLFAKKLKNPKIPLTKPDL